MKAANFNIALGAETADRFLSALLTASKDHNIIVNISINYEKGEDALADAKLAIGLRYGNGVSICEALAQR